MEQVVFGDDYRTYEHLVLMKNPHGVMCRIESQHISTPCWIFKDFRHNETLDNYNFKANGLTSIKHTALWNHEASKYEVKHNAKRLAIYFLLILTVYFVVNSDASEYFSNRFKKFDLCKLFRFKSFLTRILIVVF